MPYDDATLRVMEHGCWPTVGGEERPRSIPGYIQTHEASTSSALHDKLEALSWSSPDERMFGSIAHEVAIELISSNTPKRYLMELIRTFRSFDTKVDDRDDEFALNLPALLIRLYRSSQGLGNDRGRGSVELTRYLISKLDRASDLSTARWFFECVATFWQVEQIMKLRGLK